MKIARRSSGGRGEYELAGELAGVHPADVYEKDLIIRIGWLELPTEVTVREQGGKPRLRRKASGIQAPRQLAALLLMPSPIREDAAMQPGEPVLRDNAYAMEEVDVADIVVNGGAFAIALGRILVKNQTDEQVIDPSIRISRVRAMWSNAWRFPPHVRDALLQHRGEVMSGGALSASGEAAVRVISEYVEGDPLGGN